MDTVRARVFFLGHGTVKRDTEIQRGSEVVMGHCTVEGTVVKVDSGIVRVDRGTVRVESESGYSDCKGMGGA